MFLKKSSDRTNSVQKDKDLKPILFRLNVEFTQKKVYEILPKFNFESLNNEPDYHEIYAKKDNMEYTFTFIGDFGKTYLSILIYYEKKSFRLKQALKEIVMFVRDELSEFIES